jgi:hypothetical protein
MANISVFPALFINAIVLFFTYKYLQRNNQHRIQFNNIKLASTSFASFYLIFSIIAIYFFIENLFPAYLVLNKVVGLALYPLLALDRLIDILFLIIKCVGIGYLLCYLLAKSLDYFFKIEKEKSYQIALVFCTLVFFIVLKNIVWIKELGWWNWQNNLLVYALLYLGTLLAYIVYQGLDKTSLQILVAILLQIEYFIGMTIVDGNPIILRTQIHAGVMIFLVFILLENILSLMHQNYRVKILLTVLLLIGAFFPVNSLHVYAYGTDPIRNNQKIVDLPKLNYLYGQTPFIDAMRTVSQLYVENRCKDKVFIAWPFIPLFYYLYDKPSVPILGFPAYSIILDSLKNAKQGYCFLYGPYGEPTPEELRNNSDYSKIMSFLKNNSNTQTKVNIVSEARVIEAPNFFILYSSDGVKTKWKK